MTPQRQRESHTRPRYRYRWLAALILGTSLVTLSTLTFALTMAEHRLLAASGTTLTLAAADIADKMDLVLYERSGDLQALSRASAPLLAHGDRMGLAELLASVQQAYPIYLWIGLADSTGRIVAATDAESVGQDRSSQAWFHAVAKGETLYTENPRRDADAGGAMAILFSAPVIGAEDRLLGVVTTRVSITPLSDLIARTFRVFGEAHGSLGAAEWEFLGRDGTVLDESQPQGRVPVNLLDLNTPSARLSLDLAQAPGYIEEHHTRRGITVVTGYAHTRGYGRFESPLFGILIRLDRTDLLAPIRTMLWQAGTVVVVAVLPLLSLTLWSTWKVQRAWQRVATSEEEVRQLNAELEHRVAAQTAHLKASFVRLEEEHWLQLLGSKISKSLVGELSLFDGLRAGTDAIVEYLGAAFARIWTLNPAEDVLILQASAGMYTNLEGRHARVPVGQYKIGLIAQERKPHLTNHVIGDPRVHDQEWAKREGLVSFAGYPLLVEGRVLGVLALFAKQPLSDDVFRDLQTIAHTIAMFIDRKQAVETLHRREAWFRSIIEHAADIIVVLDQEGAILFESPSVQSVFGHPPEEAVGRSVFEFAHPDDQLKVREAMAQAFATPGSLTALDVRVRTKDGTWREVEVRGHVFAEDGGQPQHVLNIRDITERKAMEAHSHEVERLAALGQLLSGIAHEIRNPLFILTGRLQLIQDALRHPPAGDLAPHVVKIEEAAKRLTTITNRFLELARNAPTRPDWCAVPAVLQGMLDFLSNELMRNQIRIVTQFAADLPEVWADRRQLEEIALNLLLNAIQAMTRAHGKGTLTVTATPAVQRRPAAEDQPGIEIRIQDDGPGIPPEHLPKIFDPFFSTKPPAEGTGLGLWIVRMNLMTIGGSVQVETEVGQGTTFIVWLPVAEEPFTSVDPKAPDLGFE